MNCKYCQAEMPEDAPFCPYCGKDNREEAFEPALKVEAVEEILEQTGEAVVVVENEEPEQETVSELEEAMASPQLKKMKRIAVLSGCIAVLAILATVLFFGIRGSGDGTNDGWDVASWFAWMKPRQDSLLGNDSYSVSDRKAWNKRNDVVATMPGAQLTNGQLQIYYWMQVIDFVNNYSYYLSYFGMDYKQPLDEQKSMMEDGSTWQQYFLSSALEMWQSNQAFAQLAAEANFQLDEEYQAYLDGMEASLNESAKKNGFEDATAMLQEEMGPGCTVEDYLAYVKASALGSEYFGTLYDAIDPTAAQIEAFFTEKEAEFKQEEITKDSGKYYTIRHIQFKLTGGTKDAEGNTVYTEEEWKTCLDKAQKVMDTWTAGEKTEDSFAALVKENTEDTNTQENGGKLAGFAKGDLSKVYGESMDSWVTEESRKAGDCELVKTESGYHMVFFVESEDIWYTEARQGLISQLSSELVADTLEKYPVDIDYKKIVLGVVEFGS